MKFKKNDRVRHPVFGLGTVINVEENSDVGVQHQVLLEKVFPWNNRLEAQIEGTVKGMSITFFDSLYGQHKAFYRAGKYYQFILAGFAYSCAVIEPKPITITDPDVIQFMRKMRKKRGNGLSPIQVETKGMAVLLPIPKWDRDDYQFQAPFSILI